MSLTADPTAEAGSLRGGFRLRPARPIVVLDQDISRLRRRAYRGREQL